MAIAQWFNEIKAEKATCHKTILILSWLYSRFDKFGKILQLLLKSKKVTITYPAWPKTITKNEKKGNWN